MEPAKNNDPFPAPDSRMCFWYYKGTTSLEPRLALITEVGHAGVLALNVLCKDRETFMCVTGAHHKDDPFHATHPTHALESGCWDYLPKQDPRPTEADKLYQESLRSSGPITSGPGSKAFQKK
jgi:hypothetical protein